MEAKIRHLEMIRSEISEAASNSLRIKGFAMLMIAGSLALTLGDGASVSALSLPVAAIMMLIMVSLMLLDFYYTRQSDLFKILYNKVQARSDGNIDFSMEVYQYSDELNQQHKEIWPLPVAPDVFFYTSILMFLIFGMLPFA